MGETGKLEIEQLISLDRLMQFARLLIVPLTATVSALGAAMSALNTQVQGIDGRVDTLETEELHCYVDLATGNLMYEKVIPSNQNENE